MVSTNLCVADLVDPGIVSRLTSTPFLDAAHVLVLEVTESSAIDDAAVAAAIDVLGWATSIGRTLGALTLVEGVETDSEADLVRSVGAELAQGYWFGRPAPQSQPTHARA